MSIARLRPSIGAIALLSAGLVLPACRDRSEIESAARQLPADLPAAFYIPPDAAEVGYMPREESQGQVWLMLWYRIREAYPAPDFQAALRSHFASLGWQNLTGTDMPSTAPEKEGALPDAIRTHREVFPGVWQAPRPGIDDFWVWGGRWIHGEDEMVEAFLTYTPERRSVWASLTYHKGPEAKSLINQYVATFGRRWEEGGGVPASQSADAEGGPSRAVSTTQASP